MKRLWLRCETIYTCDRLCVFRGIVEDDSFSLVMFLLLLCSIHYVRKDLAYTFPVLEMFCWRPPSKILTCLDEMAADTI